jgi:murein DD-endopeptidase MepM/ murein hydrolase activator NlpD
MADEAQTLQEFTKNLLSDVENGTLSVHEALAAAEQYAYLREEISAASLTLSEAAAAGDDELTRAFISLITATIDKITELPNFQSQQPDSPETEKEIRDTAQLQKVAATRLRETTANKPGKDTRRAFVHELVTRFSGTVPSLSEREMERLVTASAAIASQQPKEEREQRFRAELSTKIAENSGALPQNQRQTIASIVEATTTARADAVTDQIRVVGDEVAVFSALFNAENMKRPDVFADIVLHAPGSENLDQTLARAEKLARAAQALEEAAGTRGGKLQFFSSDGAKGVAGGLQKGADGILSLVGEPVRDMVLKEKVNGTLRSMLSSTQQFADRLGESFVHSALFTQIGQDLTKQLSQKPQGGGARGVFDDVFSSVFRGPLNQPLTGSTKNAILDYYELARANAAAPSGRTFLAPGVLPWDIYRVVDRAKGASSSLGASGGRPRSFFSFFGLGSAGSVVGDLFSGLIDRTTSFALLNPRLPGQLSAGRRAAAIPTAIVDDMPLFVALVVVVVLVLLFIFPSPLNLNQISHSSKMSALMSALQNEEGDAGGIGSSVDCKKNPTSPLCSFKSCTGDCRWPTSGYITQGPNVQCESNSSHNNGEDSNGVDIATVGSPNMQVYSVAAGTVKVINSSCADNSGKLGNTCGHGYGNYVTIQHDNGYLVIYAHLKSSINPSLRVGGPVSAHEQIGWMDQTGNSSGQHLHFGVLSGGGVLDLLPDTPINKSDIMGCSSLSARCAAAGKRCPSTAVSAQ